MAPLEFANKPSLSVTPPPIEAPSSERGTENALGVDGRDDSGCFLFAGPEDENSPLFGKRVALIIPILAVRTKVPKSLLHWAIKSERRLKIAGYMNKDSEHLTTLLKVKLETPAKQCELRQMIAAFREVAKPNQ
ncbi:hypothetical protein RvY_13574 [Ramazzottius varieornatus]|uniref:Uncharacterized protein n=1 Tax=Ramazzottius varieornatus TaxID=947166 RepID=A0A1D1VVS5_RAMVA|nr:hypothetical protein RvY_13574 [Ramazzottius varieornatus]